MNTIASIAPTTTLRVHVGGARYIASCMVKHLLRRCGDVVIFGNLSARCHSPVRKSISILLGNLADRANPVTSLLPPPAYDKHHAADSTVSFPIEQGEVVGIIGHNGAGKSTLLKMLARISTPTHGSIKVNGRIAPLIEVGCRRGLRII